MEHLTGPDFPTGGRICGKQAILSAYATGRGILEMRARCEIVEPEKAAPEIVVTEIPYQVGRETLVKRIADAAKADRVRGIADVRNESDTRTRVSD